MQRSNWFSTVFKTSWRSRNIEFCSWFSFYQNFYRNLQQTRCAVAHCYGVVTSFCFFTTRTVCIEYFRSVFSKPSIQASCWQFNSDCFRFSCSFLKLEIKFDANLLLLNGNDFNNENSRKTNNYGSRLNTPTMTKLARADMCSKRYKLQKTVFGLLP